MIYFSDIGLDIQDSMGRHEVGLVENSDKVPVNDDKGCKFSSKFQINKVSFGFLFFLYTWKFLIKFWCSVMVVTFICRQFNTESTSPV